jgi:DNA ligase (NAD+)
MVGVDLICENDNCPAQTVKKIEHFLKTIGVMGVALSTLEKLNISTIKELYELTVNDMTKIDGFGLKKAESIYNEIREKLVMDQSTFFESLGISGLGNTNSKLITSKISFDEIWTTEDFAFIDGIGQITSDSIVSGLKEKSYIYPLLLEYGLKWKEKSTDSEFFGKVFTVTGTAPIKRDDLIRILENKGAIVKSISKKTDYLVTDDFDSNSSKAKKAREFGIPFMSYNDLLKNLGVYE